MHSLYLFSLFLMSEAQFDPVVNCCSGGGSCVLLPEAECEARAIQMSEHSQLQNVRESLFVSDDAVDWLLSSKDSFEVKVTGCEEPFTRGAGSVPAYNCSVSIVGTEHSLKAVWPNFDRRPERGNDAFASPQVGHNFLIVIDERHAKLTVLAALELAPEGM